MQTLVATAASPLPVVPVGEPDELLPGVQAGPWVVERELGRGGMGAVYAVVHDGIGKRAALKVMHRRLVNVSSIERILLEARVVNQVGHPNIVDIFETGALADGRPYIVMERLDGVALSQRADDGKILPDQVIDILLQVCDALIAAHAAGVVHRDLKLDNLFLIDNPDDPARPRVKLLDWGIAKVISHDSRNTIDGQLLGTPQYLAPEQARGAAVSPMTDVYSLGVMAYELFVEQLPFEAETSAEIMAMHLRATPPPPSDLWPDIPPALEQLILTMLAKDPAARPSMLVVAHTLEIVRAELARRRSPDGAAAPRCARWTSAPGLTQPDPAHWRPSSRRWQIGIGAIALVSSAAMFMLSRDGDSAAAAALPRLTATSATSVASVAEPAIATQTDVVASTPSPSTIPAEPARWLAASPAPAAPVRTHPALGSSMTQHASHASRKAPVTPRRALALDPDGTVDPYR